MPLTLDKDLMISFLLLSVGFLLGGLIIHLISNGNLKVEREKTRNAAVEFERTQNFIRNLKEQSDDFENKWMEQLDHNKELIRQKSSQATKSGNYIETLSPLLDKFPVDIYDSNTSTKWLGDPIDFIAFNFEVPEIIFIEIKSGDANLSSRQKIIKKAIKEGLVRFVEVRMNSDGTTESSE